MSREGREGGEGFLWTKFLTGTKSICEWRWIVNSENTLWADFIQTLH
jgi:hypothetical protein